jgi:hypothetical protein
MDYFGKRNYHPVSASLPGASYSGLLFSDSFIVCVRIAGLPCHPSRRKEAGTRRILQPKDNVVSLAPRRQLRNAASGVCHAWPPGRPKSRRRYCICSHR